MSNFAPSNQKHSTIATDFVPSFFSAYKHRYWYAIFFCQNPNVEQKFWVADRTLEHLNPPFFDDGPLRKDKRMMRFHMSDPDTWLVNGEPAVYSVFIKFKFGWLGPDVSKCIPALQRDYEKLIAQAGMDSLGAYEAMCALWPPKAFHGQKYRSLIDCGQIVDTKKYRGRERQPLPQTDTEDEVSKSNSWNERSMHVWV
jgi:hypothetical protein